MPPRAAGPGGLDTPPPIRFHLLLPLLLAICGLGALAPDAMADEVKLRSYVETDKMDGDGTVAFNSGPDAARVEGTFSKTFWARGVGYTNDWRYWIFDTYQYTTNNPAGPGSTTYYGLHFTNQVFHGWSGAALADGTQSDAQRTVQDVYDDAMVLIHSDTNVTSSSTNASFTYADGSPWLGAAYKYTDTNSAPPRTYELSRVSEVDLITSSNSTSTGAALFKLTTSMFDSYQNAITNGYTVASNTPVNGVVFKVFNDGTTNPVTPVITATNTHTNYSFNITPQRVALSLQWKSSNTNDTNWLSGDVFALKGTTVLFKVTTDPTPVTFPTGLPTWSHGGAAGDTQISVTFNTISANTNGEWVIVTAGSMASNRVVVFDYEVKFQPTEGPGRFEGRATYPTGFGVGETVDFVALFAPTGVTTTAVGGVDWTVTGMYYDSSYLEDLSETNATSIRLGAFEETDQVTGTLLGGVSAGASRNAQFSAWKPKAAILKDMMVTQLPATGPLFAWPDVGHTSNTITCYKRAAYFLLPQSNSYHGVLVREGAGLYSYSNGSNSVVNNTITTQITFTLTNAAGTTILATNNSFVRSPANHAIGGWGSMFHLPFDPGGALQQNYWGIDRFGETVATVDGVLPGPSGHVPIILTTLSVPIVIEFKVLTSEIYFICAVTSKRDIYSTGRMEIEKKKAGVGGSGPHSKEFTDGSSSD